METTMQVNNKLLTRCKAICKQGFSVLGWAVVGAVVGATAAGLYGVLCGTLDGLIHGDLWRLALIGLYCALCGAVAGALVGGFARIIDPEGVADLTNIISMMSREENAGNCRFVPYRRSRSKSILFMVMSGGWSIAGGIRGRDVGV
jgi:hypothetical protein